RFFRDCPHPGNKQRTELSQDIGIDPLQVKFWFQNKRTQMKTKHERQNNTNLRAENEKIRAENVRFREALSNLSCPSCGSMADIGDVLLDERHLRMENARLRDEVMHYSHKLFLIFVYVKIYYFRPIIIAHFKKCT
ncbi:homeobox-leucine zipper protein roc7, partial [Phtheirospermum japonicum]